MTQIDQLSVTSLYIEMSASGQTLSSGTGFVVQHEAASYLVSNHHVLAGRDPDSGQPLHKIAAVPDALKVLVPGATLGAWEWHAETLYDSAGECRRIDHPSAYDVAAVPLTKTKPTVRIYPLDLDLAKVDMIARPAMPVQIIGFPFGMSSTAGLPIWKTGHIASEPDIDYQDAPVFLIDATTRQGMSGAPVYLRLWGGYETESGKAMIGAAKPTTKFMGIYSGRIHERSEIGRVWRPIVIRDLFG